MKKKYGKLVSEPNYYSTKYISKKLLVIEMKKHEIYMKKPVYLGQAILELRKLLMYEFCYEYNKPKYASNGNLCYMVTDNFIMQVNIADFYHAISNDVKFMV